MGHEPLLPVELLRGPFTAEEARSAGLARWHLEGRSWRRIGPATYVWSGLAYGPMHRLDGALRRLPKGAVLSGLTAAWLHGIESTLFDPIEATIPATFGVSGRSGIKLSRSPLTRNEIAHVRGFPVTSILRTITDLSARLSLVEGVVMMDAALHSRGLRASHVQAWLDSKAGRRGTRRVMRVLEHAEPAAESPMESRLRMVLILGGLPRPQSQVPIHDRWGRFVGRPDLYYESHRLGIEYDGAGHRDRLADDNRRQNNLLRAGVRLLRFTAGDVLGKPDSLVMQVRQVLAEPAVAGKCGLEAVSMPASAGRSGLGRSA